MIIFALMVYWICAWIFYFMFPSLLILSTSGAIVLATMLFILIPVIAVILILEYWINF